MEKDYSVMNNTLSLLPMALSGIFLTVICTFSYKIRYWLFLFLIFLCISRLVVPIGFGSDITARLPLMLLLSISSMKEITKILQNRTLRKPMFTILIWTVYLLLSWAVAPTHSLNYAYGTVSNLLFFMLILAFMDQMTKKEMIGIVVVYTLSLIPKVTYNFPVAREITLSLGFYSGEVYHQLTGQAATYLLPLLLFFWNMTKKVLYKIGIVAVVIGLYYSIVNSGARTPLIIFNFVLLFWWRKFKTALLLLIILSLAFTFLFLGIQERTVSSRYERIFSMFSSGDVSEEENVEFRYEHLVYGLQAFTEKPIFGHGYESWYRAIEGRYSLLGYRMPAHNEPLRILVEYGLFGFLLFMLLISNSIKNLHKKPSNEFFDGFPNMIFVSIVLGLALNLFMNEMFSKHFYFLLAVGASLQSRKPLEWLALWNQRN